MNWNVIRTTMATIGTALLAIVQFAPGFLGCTKDAITEKFDCAGSWLPANWAIIVALVLWIATLIAKALTQGGTVSENLTNKAVVVTPVDKQGTVTPTQVKTGLPT